VPSYRPSSLTEQTSALWRQRWLLLAIALGVTLVAALWSIRSGGWSSTASIAVVDESAAAAAAGLSTAVAPLRTASGEVAFLEGIGDAVEDEIGGSFAIIVTPLDGARRIDVTATGGRREVEEQLAVVVDRYLEERRLDRVSSLQSGIAAREARITENEQHLREISDVLASSDPGTSNAIDSLQLERLRTLEAITRLRDEQDSIGELIAITSGGVAAVAPPTDAKRGAADATKVLASLVFGLMVAVGVGMVRTKFDRKLRSVADLRAVSPDLSVLGVASSGDLDAGHRYLIPAMAIRRRAVALEARRLLICPISHSAAAHDLASGVESVLGSAAFEEIRVAAPFASSQEALVLAAEFHHAVLVVAPGVDSSEQLESAVSQLEAVGATLLGLVMADGSAGRITPDGGGSNSTRPD